MHTIVPFHLPVFHLAAHRRRGLARIIDPRLAPVGAKFPRWTTEDMLGFMSARAVTSWEVPTYPVGAKFPRRTAAERAQRTPVALTSEVVVPIGAKFHGAPFASAG